MNNKPTVAISTDFLTAYAALPRQKQGLHYDTSL